MTLKVHNLGEIFDPQIGIDSSTFPALDPYQKEGRAFIYNVIMQLTQDVGKLDGLIAQGSMYALNMVEWALRTNSAKLIDIKDMLQEKLINFENALQMIDDDNPQRDYYVSIINTLNKCIDLMKKSINFETSSFDKLNIV